MSSADLEQIKGKLKEIIVNDLDTDILIEDIQEDISLYEDGIGLDSINIVNLIVLIEDRFNIEFGDQEINTSMFSNINNLAAFIHKKTATRYA